jgi:hypothetical protein
MKRLVILTAAVATLAGAAAAEVSDKVIKNTFQLYEGWTPTAAGYEPGVRITKENVDKFKDILDPFTARYIQKGWFEMQTGPTFSMPTNTSYVKATREHADKVSLSPQGTLVNFVAGRPFPQEPDAKDPQAGLKLIWNFQRSINAGDSETIHPFWWTFRNTKTGQTERQIRFEWHFLNWKHRVMFDPKPSIEPNPAQIFRSIYSVVLEPFDLANTQLLIHRYEDDLQRDDGWLYLGFQRRVRRLAVGQITDAFLGTDAMIEDFEGYNGRVSDYQWTYRGTQNILMPYEKHNEQAVLDKEPVGDKDGFRFIKFGGQGNCFPQVTWQLRKAYVIEGSPKDANHPLSKRVLYMDSESATLPVVLLYDKKGTPWKYFPICKTHSDHHLKGNKGVGVAIDDCALFFDEQAMHCTTLQFKSYINPQENPPSIFNVQNMRKTGR